MKKKLILSIFVALALTVGTVFFDISSLEPSDGVPASQSIFDVVNLKGFPFSFVEEQVSDGITRQDVINAESEVLPMAFVASWVSWIIIVFLGLVILDWLASFVSKLIIRIIIGLAVSAYGLFIILW